MRWLVVANGLARKAEEEIGGRTLAGILSDFQGDRRAGHCRPEKRDRDAAPLHARYANSQLFFHVTASTPGSPWREFLLAAIPFGSGLDDIGHCRGDGAGAARRWHGHLVLPRLVHTPEGFVNSLLVEPDMTGGELAKLFAGRTRACLLEAGNHVFSIVAEGETGARWLRHLRRSGYRFGREMADAEPRPAGGGRLDDNALAEGLARCRIDVGDWHATMSGPEIATVRLHLAQALSGPARED